MKKNKFIQHGIIAYYFGAEKNTLCLTYFLDTNMETKLKKNNITVKTKNRLNTLPSEVNQNLFWFVW